MAHPVRASFALVCILIAYPAAALAQNAPTPGTCCPDKAGAQDEPSDKASGSPDVKSERSKSYDVERRERPAKGPVEGTCCEGGKTPAVKSKEEGVCCEGDGQGARTPNY